MNQEDLNKLLNLHELYLKHKAKGKCLELVNEDLSNLIFSNRDLSGSKFINCNFECAKLKNIYMDFTTSEQVHMQKSHWKNLSNLTIYV